MMGWARTLFKVYVLGEQRDKLFKELRTLTFGDKRDPEIVSEIEEINIEIGKLLEPTYGID